MWWPLYLFAAPDLESGQAGWHQQEFRQRESENDPCQLGKENGAVCEDCAEPHENPNLTLYSLTGRQGIRSNGTEEKEWILTAVFG